MKPKHPVKEKNWSSLKEEDRGVKKENTFI